MKRGRAPRRRRSDSVPTRGSEARRARRRRRLRRDARRDRGVRRGRRRRARLEDPPGAQPLRRGRGRDQRRARATPPRTTPRSTPSTRSRARTTSATRTRSRSSATRRRTTSTSSSTGARSSRAPRTAGSRSGPFGAAGEPRTAYAADITGHVLIHVLYEQVMKRDIRVYEEFFAWKLVDRRRPLPGRDRVGPPQRRPEDDRREDGDPLRRAAPGRLYTGTTNAYACTGDGMAHGAARRASPLEGHGDDAVPPDDARADRGADHRGLPRRGRVPAQRRGRALPEELRAERDGARLAATSSRAPSRPRSTRAAASTATSCSTCATSAPRRSSSGCTGRASSR